jgi:hypothetical protein
LPVVERVLRWYEPYIDEHGTLSDLPEWNLIDWSSVFSSGRSSLITGLWARGLAEYAEMADWLGNTASAAWARGLWEQARDGYEDFWDPARGSYVDHIVDGEQQPAMSQAAGAVAIVSGLAPQDQWAGIVDVITDPSRLVVRSWIGGEDGGYDMIKIAEHSQGIYRIDWDVDREIVLAEPFFSYVVHDAVAAAGRADRLPSLLRRWSVFLYDGFDTFGECWGWGTPVHAWSATPTKDLVWYVLGVTPAEPGPTVPILYLMARDLQRHLLPVLLPGLLAAGALIAVDQIVGSAAFGAAAIIAAVVANAGQSIELVRAKRIVGVSVLFLILAVVNQGLWLSWAILVPDIGTMIFATVTGIITVFNLTWWSLRMLGQRPLFAAGIPGQRRGHTEVQPQPAGSPGLAGAGARPHQAYAWGASPGPGQICSSRSATSASSCTDSAPRSDCSSSIVVAPTTVVATTGFRSSQASATSAGFAPNSRHSPS